MALRQIRIVGDPLLRERSNEVKEITDRTKELIEDMIETMRDSDGAGIAAPQVGVLRRIVVIEYEDEPIVMINPVISNKEGEVSGLEACLSVPDRAGRVMRPEKLNLEYMDENGEMNNIEATDFLARVICHETDHLDGVLYIDKMYEEVFEEDLIEEGDE